MEVDVCCVLFKDSALSHVFDRERSSGGVLLINVLFGCVYRSKYY